MTYIEIPQSTIASDPTFKAIQNKVEIIYSSKFTPPYSLSKAYKKLIQLDGATYESYDLYYITSTYSYMVTIVIQNNNIDIQNFMNVETATDTATEDKVLTTDEIKVDKHFNDI